MGKRFLLLLIVCLSVSKLFAQDKHTISGILKDAADGEVLIGATIYVEEIKSGTVTNIYGFYSLTLPQGKYTVTISYIGYTPITKEIDLSEDFKLSIELQNESISIETFEVTAEKEQKNVEETEMSTVTLQMEKVKKYRHFLVRLMCLKPFNYYRVFSLVEKVQLDFLLEEDLLIKI